MKMISHILILVLIVSLYVSYCQWQCSHYYMFSAAMERKQNWPKTILFAAKAAKANPFNDKPMHVLGRALLEQGHLQAGISITKQVLAVRPYKKYLLHNLKHGIEKLKSGQSNERKP